MKLISESMERELVSLSGLLFTGNSIFDNASYKLSVKFTMPRTAEIVHLSLAHEFPLLSDKISEYADSRNASFSRPPVQKSDKDYDNTKELFDDLLAYMIDLENMVCCVIESAVKENDIVTKVFLDSVLLDIIKYTKITLGFCDYIEANGNTNKDNLFMDSVIDKFLRI